MRQTIKFAKTRAACFAARKCYTMTWDTRPDARSVWSVRRAGVIVL